MSRPLDGIRVLEIGAYIAGPYAGAMLCAMGAEVIKVEPPGGDPFRRGNGNRDPYFRQYNAGKHSIVIDLKAPEGVALVKALLPGLDVLLENNRPGALDRLGLAAAACRAINPRLIYASASGFGDGGPLRDRPAYDSIGPDRLGVLLADERSRRGEDAGRRLGRSDDCGDGGDGDPGCPGRAQPVAGRGGDAHADLADGGDVGPDRRCGDELLRTRRHTDPPVAPRTGRRVIACRPATAAP